MAIENIIGEAGLMTCILLDIYFVWKLKRDIRHEKLIATNGIDYETACKQLTAEQKGNQVKQSEKV